MLSIIAKVQVSIIVTVTIQAIVAIFQPLNVKDQQSLMDHSSWGDMLKDMNPL